MAIKKPNFFIISAPVKIWGYLQCNDVSSEWALDMGAVDPLYNSGLFCIGGGGPGPTVLVNCISPILACFSLTKLAGGGGGQRSAVI